MKLPTQPDKYDRYIEQQRSGILERELLRVSTAISVIPGAEPDGTAADPVAVRIIKTTDNQLMPSGTPVTVSFDSVVRDDGGLYNAGAPTRLTAPSAGWYSFSASWVMSADSNAGNAAITLIHGDVSASTEITVARNIFRIASGSLTVPCASTLVYMDTGDYVLSQAWRSSISSGISVLGAPGTFMSLAKTG